MEFIKICKFCGCSDSNTIYKDNKSIIDHNLFEENEFDDISEKHIENKNKYIEELKREIYES